MSVRPLDKAIWPSYTDSFDSRSLCSRGIRYATHSRMPSFLYDRECSREMTSLGTNKERVSLICGSVAVEHVRDVQMLRELNDIESRHGSQGAIVGHEYPLPSVIAAATSEV